MRLCKPNGACYNTDMEVDLTMLLDARERRQARHIAAAARFPGAALGCLTINMPGPEKKTPQTERLFRAGAAAVRAALSEAGFALLSEDLFLLPTGDEYDFIAAAEPLPLKMRMCMLEESAPYGRLFDIDVFDARGCPLSRADAGFPERGCMVCGRPGRDCASRRLHPLPVILAAVGRLAATLPETEA